MRNPRRMRGLSPRRKPLTRLRFAKPPSPTRGEGKQLPQLDLVGDFVREADAAERQHHFGRQLFMALETAAGDRVAHRLFDFALRGDADLLQEFAQAAV